jgi:hypothetical protein
MVQQLTLELHLLLVGELVLTLLQYHEKSYVNSKKKKTE